MAALLGKAAASHWKRATFGEHAVSEQNIDWQALSLDIRLQRAREKALAAGNNDQEAAIKKSSLGKATAARASTDTGKEGAAALLVTGGSSEHQCNSNRPGLAELVTSKLAGQRSILDRKYNPEKQRLADLGSVEPANVGRTLLRELSRRSSIDAVLTQVEWSVRRQGPAQQLRQHEAKVITRAVNRLMLRGISRQVPSQYVY
jgi:hypothetical protein